MLEGRERKLKEVKGISSKLRLFLYRRDSCLKSYLRAEIFLFRNEIPLYHLLVILLFDGYSRSGTQTKYLFNSLIASFLNRLIASFSLKTLASSHASTFLYQFDDNLF